MKLLFTGYRMRDHKFKTERKQCVISVQSNLHTNINTSIRFIFLLLHYLIRLYDLERKRQEQAQSELRSAAHGTGDRSDKIRTYNFPQDRVTDHRVGVTVSGVARVLAGELLSDIIHPLVDAHEADRLTELLQKLSEQCMDDE